MCFAAPDYRVHKYTFVYRVPGTRTVPGYRVQGTFVYRYTKCAVTGLRLRSCCFSSGILLHTVYYSIPRCTLVCTVTPWVLIELVVRTPTMFCCMQYISVFFSFHLSLWLVVGVRFCRKIEHAKHGATCTYLARWRRRHVLHDCEKTAAQNFF